MARASYFAQNQILGRGHKAKTFRDLDAAREWLKRNGGGTIKRRNAGVIHDPFIGRIRTWGVIEEIAAE
jgi:hypothetical protein